MSLIICLVLYVIETNKNTIDNNKLIIIEYIISYDIDVMIIIIIIIIIAFL